MAYSGDENPLKVRYEGDEALCDETFGVAHQFYMGQQAFAKARGLDIHTASRDWPDGGSIVAQYGPGNNRELIINRPTGNYLEVAPDARIDLDLPGKLKRLAESATLTTGGNSVLGTSWFSPVATYANEGAGIFPHTKTFMQIGRLDEEEDGSLSLLHRGTVAPILLSVVDKNTLAPIGIPYEGGDGLFNVRFNSPYTVGNWSSGSSPMLSDLSDVGSIMQKWTSMTALVAQTATQSSKYSKVQLGASHFAMQYGFNPGDSIPGQTMLDFWHVGARAAVGAGTLIDGNEDFDSLWQPGFDGGASGTYGWLFPGFARTGITTGTGDTVSNYYAGTSYSPGVSVGLPPPDFGNIELLFAGNVIQSLPTQITYPYWAITDQDFSEIDPERFS